MKLYKCKICGSTEYYQSWKTQKNWKRAYLHRRCKPCNRKALKKSAHKSLKGIPRTKYNRLQWLLSKYGLTQEGYQKIWDDQNGLCAICKKPEGGTKITRFCVDHCHDTGIVRGLLCSACNMGIGGLRHDIEFLETATQYLLKFDKKTAILS